MPVGDLRSVGVAHGGGELLDGYRNRGRAGEPDPRRALPQRGVRRHGFFLKLHLGDPGSAGTTSPAAHTTRVAPTFSAAASGAITTRQVTWTSMTAAETISHWSAWDTVGPAGGTFLFSDNFTTARTVAIGHVRDPDRRSRHRHNHSGGVMGWRLAGVMCAAFFALTAAGSAVVTQDEAVTWGQNAPPAQDCLGEDSDILWWGSGTLAPGESFTYARRPHTGLCCLIAGTVTLACMCTK